jgi:hypothetical protein
MKTTSKTMIALLTGVALFSLAGTAPAQYKPVGDDGIAAPPKFRQVLDARKPAPSAPALPSMACPRCKTAVTSRVDPTARGANKPVILISTHACGGCASVRSTTGHGKAAREVVTHKCSFSTGKLAACCGAGKS